MNIPRLFILAFLSLGIFFESGCAHLSKYEIIPTDGVDVSGIMNAVAIAVSTLNDQPPGSPGESYILASVPPDEYILTSAQQVTVSGRYIWRITYKPKQLLPEDPSKELIGLGGEIFVNVDLSTKTTVITGGE